MKCWCGAKGSYEDLFDQSGLEESCAGTGLLSCFCGGDLCVCHHHGSAECPGCDDCRKDEHLGSDHLDTTRTWASRT